MKSWALSVRQINFWVFISDADQTRGGEKWRKICIYTLKSSDWLNSVCDNIFPCFHHPSASHKPEDRLGPPSLRHCSNALTQLCSWSLLHPLLWTLTPDFLCLGPAPVGLRNDGKAPTAHGSPAVPASSDPRLFLFRLLSDQAHNSLFHCTYQQLDIWGVKLTAHYWWILVPAALYTFPVLKLLRI